MSNVVTQKTDSDKFSWDTFYAPNRVAGWQLPGATYDDPENGIFRRLFIRWSELPKALPMTFLCGDVLELDVDVLLSQTGIVFARRVEIVGNAGLIIDRTDGNRSELFLFAQEVVHKDTRESAAIPVTALTPDANREAVETSYSFKVGETISAEGLYWSWDAAEPRRLAAADLEPAYLLAGEPLRLMLATIFQLATLLSTENVELSVSQLRWVAALARAGEETRELALQAGSLANTLLAEKAAGANALLVPQLDNTVYASASSAFMQVLNERQARWEALQRMQLEDTNWANAARDSLDDKENQQDLADKLESQAATSQQQAVQARDIATQQVVFVKGKLAECEILFEAGIERWKKKKTEEAVIEIVTGTFEILKEVPTIIAAGPEMAVLPAIQTGMSILSSAGEALATKPAPVQGPKTKEETEAEEQAGAFGPKTKEQTEAEEKAQANAAAEKTARQEAQDKLSSSLAKAATGGKKIVEAAMKIAQIAQMAATMEASSREILSSIGQTATRELSSFEVQGLDVVTGGSQEWDSLGATIEDTFENLGGGAIKEIDGGTEYRLEFRNLIIAGRALSQARLAVAKANSQLAEMRLRSQAARNAVAIAQSRVDQLGEQIGRDDTLAQLAFNKILDAKRAVYLALEAYRRAFLYFTLSDEAEAPALPRLTAPVDAFRSAVANITSRLLINSALERPPQPLTEGYVTLDAASLSSLKADEGFFTWTLPVDHKAFADMGRIRFTTMRVYVEGLTYDGHVEVQIANSGVYADKSPVDGTARHFVSEPLREAFIYDGATITGNGDKLTATIILDGGIAPRYQGDFFNPTPFTTWTFRIKAQGDQPPPDLSSVKSLNVHFIGEALAIRKSLH